MAVVSLNYLILPCPLLAGDVMISLQLIEAKFATPSLFSHICKLTAHIPGGINSPMAAVSLNYLILLCPLLAGDVLISLQLIQMSSYFVDVFPLIPTFISFLFRRGAISPR